VPTRLARCRVTTHATINFSFLTRETVGRRNEGLGSREKNGISHIFINLYKIYSSI
jgi:hypothetical protein